MVSFSRILRTVLLFAAICMCFVSAQAQKPVCIIPTPRYMQEEKGSFNIQPITKIMVENPKNTETAFAATELQAEIKTSLGINTALSQTPVKNAIILCLTERDKTLAAFLKGEKPLIPDTLGEEGYLLHITPAWVYITAHTEAGLFYGVQTLKQIIRSQGKSVPCMSILDKPVLRYRGWMDDINRGPIPTVEYLKKVIRNMAEFKQNFFNLYTENVFSSDKYPDIAPADGLKVSEIKELADYAAKYHIDMMGNFQSFGHQEKLLVNPFYAHLADNGSILNPADERTYQFISDIYSEMIPAYKSQFFNINCDETQGLGEGKSKKLADSLGVDGLYAYHINRLDKLIKPYGKQMMMWGDIAVNNPEIISRLPKDLIVLSWGYHAAESFDYAIQPFVKTGFRFMVAPGVSCWSQLWPQMSTAVKNISNYVRDGVRFGAMGMMNTCWDDNGHNLFEYNWHGLAWGAECSWSPLKQTGIKEAEAERNLRLSVFNTKMDALFFESPGIIELYSDIDKLRNGKVEGLLSENVFWDDILSIFPQNTTAEVETDNREMALQAQGLLQRLNNLRKTCKHNADNLDEAELALQRALFITHRNIARVHINNAKQTQNPADIANVRAEITNLVNELHTIKTRYMQLWSRENRQWWLDKNMGDYNRMALRLLNFDKQVYINPAPKIVDGKRLVSLNTLFNDQPIVYTADGSDLLPTSKLYTQPFEINQQTMIKAAVVKEGKIIGNGQKSAMIHKGIGHLYKLNTQFTTGNPLYAAGGEQGLLDGLKGIGNFTDGRWQGYEGNDINIEFDLTESTPVKRISIDCMQDVANWVLLPTEVQIYFSEDGANYNLVKTIPNPLPANYPNYRIQTFESEFTNAKTRFIKVIAKNIGILPAWHHAAGGKAFLFCDEIVIE